MSGSVTKFDFSSQAMKSPADSKYVQYLPCNINYDGDAKVDTYFNKYCTNSKETGLCASFRGHPLCGEEMKVPEGYTGIVAKEAKSVEENDKKDIDDSSDVVVAPKKTLKGVCAFNTFTYWNWDRKPSVADKYQQALNWIEISNVIHGETSPTKAE